MQIPSFNIFIFAAPPEKKAEKKESKLTAALKQKKDDSMLNALNNISEKLNKLPTTSHMGGG